MHVAFDIDGTICENSPEMDHDDPLSVLKHTRPKHAALARLVKLIVDGHTVSFVTARSHKVQGATMKQLKQWLPSLAGVDIFHRNFEPYELMGAVLYKLDTLRQMEPDLYVGDLPMDQTAAAAAGVPFMPAEWWAKGIPIDAIAGADFRPDALQRRAQHFSIEVVGIPPGVWECLVCGNRRRTGPGEMPALCDSCEKPGPWAQPTLEKIAAHSIQGPLMLEAVVAVNQEVASRGPIAPIAGQTATPQKAGSAPLRAVQEVNADPGGV